MRKKYLIIRSSKDIAKIKKIIRKNIRLRKKKGKKLLKKPQIRLEYY